MFNRLFLSYIFIAFTIICTSCDRDKPIPKVHSTVRISQDKDFSSLDPRRVRDLPTATILQAVYEGLTRLNAKGEPVPALAELIEISPDQTIYTFTLRSSHWSDGKPVTAQDFEQSWKSLLDPTFPAPNAYQFYVIKGAKEAKTGQLDLDQVGIKAINNQTLVVELEKPTPYFLSLTSTFFFLPVGPALRNNQQEVKTWAFNGPFQLEAWSPQNEFSIIPNPHYWDHQHVQLDRLAFIVVDNSTALQLFETDELDWMGSPLSIIPLDAMETFRASDLLFSVPAAGSYFVRLNTARDPFRSPKMRQAFSLALNREDIVDHAMQGQQQPALGIIPPSVIGKAPSRHIPSTEQAQQIFQEALTELGIQRQNLPAITLCYSSSERYHKMAQAIQQQWKQVLGVDVQLQSCEYKVFMERIQQNDYSLSLGAWFADFRDPISFLDVFKFKDNGTNNTQWENPQYIQLLDLAESTSDQIERQRILQEAETLLLDEMPVIPLSYSTYFYLKKPQLKNVYFSDLGYLDFKKAYLTSPSTD